MDAKILNKNWDNARVAHQKIFVRGGDQIMHGGGQFFFNMGGDSLPWGGDSLLMGYGPPPIPLMLGSPEVQHQNNLNRMGCDISVISIVFVKF